LRSRRDNGLYVKWYVVQRVEDIGNFRVTLEVPSPPSTTTPSPDDGLENAPAFTNSAGPSTDVVETTITTEVPSDSRVAADFTAPYIERQHFFAGWGPAQLRRLVVCLTAYDSSGNLRDGKQCRPASEELIPQASLGDLDANVMKTVKKHPSGSVASSSASRGLMMKKLDKKPNVLARLLLSFTAMVSVRVLPSYH
jgi:hypothetical protein